MKFKCYIMIETLVEVEITEPSASNHDGVIDNGFYPPALKQKSRKKKTMKQLFSDLELKAGQGGETCEKETKEVSPSITLAFCPEAHARPQGRKRDAKENTAASQSLENMR